MPFVKTFKVPAICKNGVITLDHTRKLADEDFPIEEIEESRIANKAQEIAEFNKGELEIIKSFKENGEFQISFKIIT